MMINFKSARFIKSTPSVALRPDGLFDVMFVGRSNVGKSSLINAICDRKDLAYTSSTPGHTRLLNYYLIDDKFYLVDAPGYGYIARGPRDAFATMMEDYFTHVVPRLVIFLFDSRRIPTDEDVTFLRFLAHSGTEVLLVLTKADKLSQADKVSIRKNVEPLLKQYQNREYLLVSIRNSASVERVKAAIAAAISK